MTRNFDVRRFNTRVHKDKVPLDRDELVGLLSEGELSSLREATAEEGDTPPINDPSYDFVEELSKVRYAPAD